MLLGAAPARSAGGVRGPGGEPAPAPKLDLKGVTVEHWIQNALTHPEGMAKEQVMQNFSTQSGARGATVTSSGGQAIDKVIAALAAGTPPDLVDGFHFNMSALYRQGATVDVEGELKGDPEWRKLRPGLYPEIANGFTWKGTMFARAPLQQLLQHVLPAGAPEAGRHRDPAAEDVGLGAVHRPGQARRPARRTCGATRTSGPTPARG